jgi:hypothetical protein
MILQDALYGKRRHGSFMACSKRQSYAKQASELAGLLLTFNYCQMRCHQAPGALHQAILGMEIRLQR